LLLERLDIKHKDACKLFANKFSCGASLVKGKTDEIDIQGEVSDELKTLIMEKWSVCRERECVCVCVVAIDASVRVGIDHL
jgi:density-regulated protein DRP1